MDCLRTEHWLSDYMESSLPEDERIRVAEHLAGCQKCSALFDEMRAATALFRNYPDQEMDPDLLERVLLRTSGRPRRRSFRERLDRYFLRPLLTPRFVAGASLATLFLILMLNLLMPRMPGVVSALSPSEMFRLMDRTAQQLYGAGLKAYDKKNEWQAQFDFFKDNMLNRLRFLIEQMEPVEGRKKSTEPMPQDKGTAPEKSSRLLLRPA